MDKDGGWSYILYADTDYAESWASDPPRETHYFHAVLGTREVTETEFRAVVERRHGNGKSQRALHYIGKLKARRRQVTISRWLRRVFFGMNLVIVVIYCAVMLRPW